MIDRADFSAVMSYLSSGTGKEISADSAEVYFDLLGDLPLHVLQLAAKKVLLEGRYPVFPTVGQIRDTALAVSKGGNSDGWSEAWSLARKASGVLSCDLDFIGRERREDVQARVLKKLPDAVRRAGTAIGWLEIYEPINPEATRAHFRSAYEVTSERQRREALMPAGVSGLIKGIAEHFAVEQLEGRA